MVINLIQQRNKIQRELKKIYIQAQSILIFFALQNSLHICGCFTVSTCFQNSLKLITTLH